jgi:hypothetical protein
MQKVNKIDASKNAFNYCNNEIWDIYTISIGQSSIYNINAVKMKRSEN